MLLAADIGNTSITLGLFDESAVVEEFRLASDKEMPQDEYENLLRALFKNVKVDACVLASVVDELTDRFERAVNNVFSLKTLVLSASNQSEIKIPLENPDEMGADRIANVIGASVLYKKPIIVVDFGTATTFDIIDENNVFIGGVIAPGLSIQLKSLNEFTSKLPKIEVAVSSVAMGRSTEEAILSGVIRGSACMIEGLIAQCENELGKKATIVTTGGYSGLISNYMKKPFDFINPNLTLDGLRIFYLIHQNSGNRSGHKASERSAN